MYKKRRSLSTFCRKLSMKGSFIYADDRLEEGDRKLCPLHRSEVSPIAAVSFAPG
jgi:hypothetical protein